MGCARYGVLQISIISPLGQEGHAPTFHADCEDSPTESQTTPSKSRAQTSEAVAAMTLRFGALDEITGCTPETRGKG